MNRADMAAALSLSCVENYFLAWCREYFDERVLYCSSFIGFDTVTCDFCERGAQYENYDAIARVQDVARALRLTSQQMIRARDIPECESGSLLLLSVNEKFFERSKTVPWRKDHYICARRKDEKTFEYYNNYPLSSGIISFDELMRVRADKSLIFRVINRADKAKERELAKLQLERIAQCAHGIVTARGETSRLRNAAGILKISRKRLLHWLRYLGESGNICQKNCITRLAVVVRRLETLYIKFELAALRKCGDDSSLRREYEETAKEDMKICREMKFTI